MLKVSRKARLGLWVQVPPGRSRTSSPSIGLLSVLGIVFPVVVLALEPETFSVLMKSRLVGSFDAGLAGVLGYTLWYQRQLNSKD
jgi:hypothetical protein